MFENAGQQLETILGLVSKCPQALQERCFAILLQAYVDDELRGPTQIVGPAPAAVDSGVEPTPIGGPPPEVHRRLGALAKRLNVEEEELEGLFDFTADPFMYHPLEAPGGSNAERTRNVALLVAVRTYLAAGNWSADWSEVKALCVDLNCYDPANHAAYLKKSSYFKSIQIGKAIELSGSGRTAAEQVLAGLAAGK